MYVERAFALTPAVIDALPRAHRRVGSFYDVARTLIEREAFVLVTPAPNYFELANRRVQALLDLYDERAEFPDALASNAADIDVLVGE